MKNSQWLMLSLGAFHGYGGVLSAFTLLLVVLGGSFIATKRR